MKVFETNGSCNNWDDFKTNLQNCIVIKMFMNLLEFVDLETNYQRILMSNFEMNACGYDNRWNTIGEDMKKYGPFSRHTRRLLLSELSRITFESVLDVGCGPGILLEDIQKKYSKTRLFGMDFSNIAIDIAKKKIPSGKFFVMDISKESLSSEYDVVICSEVLEHIEDDESAIRNLASMTKKFLLISTPQGRMRDFEKSGVGHVRNYSRSELLEKLQINNFEILNVIEWGFPFYSPLYRDFLDLIGARGTGGKFRIGRKFLSQFLYFLFSLNSHNRGDEIIVLSQIVKN